MSASDKHNDLSHKTNTMISAISFIPFNPLTSSNRSRYISSRSTCRPVQYASANGEQSSATIYDIVVIGSGLGGLSAAALLSASYNRSVCVLEAHTHPGGAAHEFIRRTSRGTFRFEAGPHLFSGLSSSGSTSQDINSHSARQNESLPRPSANPMQHVLRAVDANLPVIPYQRWGVLLPDNVYVPTTVSPSQPLFSELVSKISGPQAAEQVATLLNAMRPLCKAATALPPAALRSGDILGSLRVSSRFLARPDLLSAIPHLSSLTAPFAPLLDKYVKDPFARNFLNLLCFLLAGVEAEKIPTAEVAFMFSEWTGATAGSDVSDSVLEHPVGGAAGIVDTLVDAIERSGYSKVRTNCPVTRVLLESSRKATSVSQRRAIGVELKSGEQVYAREGVISNVSAWNLPSLFSDKDHEAAASLPELPPMCPSFMHLNLAIELTPEVLAKLPHPLEVNYASVENWNRGVASPDNVVLITIPSLLDSSRAPPGFAVLHAYTPATEPYEPWASLEPGMPEYQSFKEARSEILWRAISRIFGQDMRKLAHIQFVGTPKTHEKFLRRKNGTYGPEIDASDSFLTLPFPHQPRTADGFWTVGDSTFPGIGVPATAASGWLAANAIASVQEHMALLRKIGL